ncbi:MAG: hypothetical protein DRQ88_11940 [Epsilonproteobacteria bacterium]|nr:MAG: hypothetical protein DRQ88_11940 [Campylobacterota bacterium]RLA65795.1 MAG: hypothetical protein DRQ89_00125 [Campylobacterota bacterium]
MEFSIVYILAITQLVVFWSWGDIALKYDKNLKRYTLSTLLGALFIWLGLSSYFSIKGDFLRNSYYFSTLIGLMIPLLIIYFVSLWDDFQELFKAMAFVVPFRYLVGFQALRILSLGTIIKYYQGQLPLHFFILGSLPDFFFSLSALYLFFYYRGGGHPTKKFIQWNIIGIIAFTGAGVSMYFSIPSLLQITDTGPNSTLIFNFPMVLAPTFTVPLFIMGNMLGILSVKMRIKTR